jgi:hypothetical protein
LSNSIKRLTTVYVHVELISKASEVASKY